jgi:hypothetical protein
MEEFMRSNLLSYLIGEKEITSSEASKRKLVKTTFFSKTTNYAELINIHYEGGEMPNFDRTGPCGNGRIGRRLGMGCNGNRFNKRNLPKCISFILGIGLMMIRHFILANSKQKKIEGGNHAKF